MRIKARLVRNCSPEATLGQIKEVGVSRIIRHLVTHLAHNGAMDEANTHLIVESTQSVFECANRFAIFEECPLCGSALSPEHAHFRCTTCGWRDSCCD
jgi:hypothetical protein